MGVGASVSRKAMGAASITRYSLSEIEEVTNRFENVIGNGGEGKVYRGVTKTNIPVAVKCLIPECCSEFEKEIQMLSDLHHPNVLSLVGYCREFDQKIIVYEFMSNGDLHQHIHHRVAGSLSWKQRLKICIGAGCGLRYLHKPTNRSPKGIIHRDIKPKNILLDGNFNAKICDFGVSKMGPQDQANSEIPTAKKGTTGYYAPEYLKSGKITRRIDVYAFGLVLCEVLCRKKPWDKDESFYPTEDEKYGLWAKENMDTDLIGVIGPECLKVFTGILEECLNLNEEKRPSMDDVVSELEYALEQQEDWEKNPDPNSFRYHPMMAERMTRLPSRISSTTTTPWTPHTPPHLHHHNHSLHHDIGRSGAPFHR